MSEDSSPIDWDWHHTALHNNEHTTLKVSEIKQLLINRGENKKETNGNKNELIKKLKEKYNVELNNNKAYKLLTGKQLLIELKLRCLSCKGGKKQQLIERLINSTPIIQQIQTNETFETCSIQIEWEHTEINELKIKYLQQLLINRDVNELNITNRNNKNELIKQLIENHKVKLTEPIHYFNCNAIKAELALYGTESYGNTLKSVLIEQYKNHIKHHTQCKEWIYLCNCNLYSTFMSNIFMINSKEFIAANNNTNIQIFNINTNDWDTLMEYNTETNLFNSWEDTNIACIDRMNNLMYIYYCTYDNKKQRLFIINYKTKCVIKRMRKNLPIIHIPAKVIFLHKQLHLIGNNKHWIFDSKKRKFNLFHTFKQHINEMNDFVLMNVPSKNKLILLFYESKQFYSYNILTHKWSKKLIKLESNLSIGGKDCCLVTGNEQYGILFGGNNLNIFVIDLNTMKLYQSKVKCVTVPSNGFRAVITHSQNDKLKQELIAFGYVRQCFKRMKIGMNIFPPYYIIKMIEEYFSDEFIHIIERNGRYSSKQRKIRVNDIVNNLI